MNHKNLGDKRREFIKATALISGGVLLNNYSWAAGAHHSVDDTIKIALVGCGGRGAGAAAQALSTKQNVKLVAMADAFEDRLEETYKGLSGKYAAKIDVPQDRRFVGFEGYKQAIALADVVLLCTPPGFRPMHFEEAVTRGKHVFMEKPVAVDPVGIRKVIAAAEIAKQKKLNVVVGLQRRYQANYREVAKRIQDGAIGDIVSGQVYWNSGGVWVRPRTASQTEMEYQMRNWYYFNWLCGDHIVEQHVHQIDVITWLKGTHPVSIQGTGSRALRTGKDYGEIFDNHAVEFTYADGSVFYSQCRHFEGTANRVDETFQGSKGRVYLSANNSGILWDSKGKQIYSHEKKGNANPYQTEHDELFAAIAKREYLFNNVPYAVDSCMAGIVGRMATYTGKVIKWDDVMKSELNLMPDKLAWDASPKVLPDASGNYPYAIPGKTKFV